MPALLETLLRVTRRASNPADEDNRDRCLHEENEERRVHDENEDRRFQQGVWALFSGDMCEFLLSQPRDYLDETSRISLGRMYDYFLVDKDDVIMTDMSEESKLDMNVSQEEGEENLPSTSELVREHPPPAPTLQDASPVPAEHDVDVSQEEEETTSPISKLDSKRPQFISALHASDTATHPQRKRPKSRITWIERLLQIKEIQPEGWIMDLLEYENALGVIESEMKARDLSAPVQQVFGNFRSLVIGDVAVEIVGNEKPVGTDQLYRTMFHKYQNLASDGKAILGSQIRNSLTGSRHGFQEALDLGLQVRKICDKYGIGFLFLFNEIMDDDFISCVTGQGKQFRQAISHLEAIDFYDLARTSGADRLGTALRERLQDIYTLDEDGQGNMIHENNGNGFAGKYIDGFAEKRGIGDEDKVGNGGEENHGKGQEEKVGIRITKKDGFQEWVPRRTEIELSPRC
ncbi:MAG: hypothetical protein Q9220_004982 [cf. Caloplaca sp. 1 TL-2023]